jgi:hypothetical protein
MIKLLDALSLPFKKKVIILFLTIMISLLLYVVSKDNTNHFLHMKILLIILPFLITWITIDMIHPHDVVIAAFYKKKYVYNYHIFYIVIWSFLLSIYFMTFYSLITIFQHHILPDITHLKLSLHLFLDILSIGFLSRLCAQSKHPTLGFIAPIIYVFIQLLTEYQQSLTLYVVFPFFQPFILHYLLAIPYKVCYISLGFMIYHIKQFN